MNKFCPQCGKTESKTHQLIKGLCDECFLKNNSLLKDYKELKLVICPSCNSYLHRNKWHQKISTDKALNLKKIIAETLPDKLRLVQESKINSIGVIIENLDDKNQKKINIQLTLNGIMHNLKSKENYPLQIIKEDSLCNLCKKKNSSYYEAKIQIRPKNEKMLRMIKEHLNRENKSIISKEEDRKFGYDIYLTDKGALSKIISEMKRAFNIEVVLSNTLYGRKDGKEVYRTTALLRLKE